VNERIRFIEVHLRGEHTVVELCRRFGNSRKQKPMGAREVAGGAGRHNPRIALPSVSAFAAIFRRNGLVRPRCRRRRTPPFTAPFAAATGPNALWCVEFKGHFPVGRTRCYPLTVTNAYSRYLPACERMSKPKTGPSGVSSRAAFRASWSSGKHYRLGASASNSSERRL
jgi:hypothetical protein